MAADLIARTAALEKKGRNRKQEPQLASFNYQTISHAVEKHAHKPLYVLMLSVSDQILFILKCRSNSWWSHVHNLCSSLSLCCKYSYEINTMMLVHFGIFYIKNYIFIVQKIHIERARATVKEYWGGGRLFPWQPKPLQSSSRGFFIACAWERACGYGVFKICSPLSR